MRKVKWLLACLPIILTCPAGATEAINKITVTDTNNFRLGREYTGLNLPASNNNPYFDGLRRYNPSQVPVPDETQAIVAMAKWVHQRWTHDPFGSAAPKTDALTLLKTVPAGAGFSCNEYSKVLRDMLRADGFVARSVTLQRSDISYGGIGSSHVAVEVFNNQLNKWMLIDAQWAFYPVYRQQPINANEIFELKQAGRFAQIDFVSFSDDDQNKQQQDLSEYRNFINQYLGYITVEQLADDEKVNVIYQLEGREWPLTFQALPRNAQIFSERLRDLYFDLNRVNLVLRYNMESQRLQNVQMDFSSDQDYLDKMPQFAAVPDFIVSPHHNMPWFDHYEYRIDTAKWQKLNGDSFAWSVRKGANRIEVRAVNRSHRPGPVTYIDINYQ